MSRSSRVCLAPCPMGGQRTTAPTPPASQMLACRACRSQSATSDTSRQAYSPGLRPSLGRPSVATGYQALHVSVLVPSFSPRLVSAEPGAQAGPSASGRPLSSALGASHSRRLLQLSASAFTTSMIPSSNVLLCIRRRASAASSYSSANLAFSAAAYSVMVCAFGVVMLRRAWASIFSSCIALITSFPFRGSRPLTRQSTFVRFAHRTCRKRRGRPGYLCVRRHGHRGINRCANARLPVWLNNARNHDVAGRRRANIPAHLHAHVAVQEIQALRVFKRGHRFRVVFQRVGDGVNNLVRRVQHHVHAPDHAADCAALQDVKHMAQRHPAVLVVVPVKIFRVVVAFRALRKESPVQCIQGAAQLHRHFHVGLAGLCHLHALSLSP